MALGGMTKYAVKCKEQGAEDSEKEGRSNRFLYLLMIPKRNNRRTQTHETVTYRGAESIRTSGQEQKFEGKLFLEQGITANQMQKNSRIKHYHFVTLN